MKVQVIDIDEYTKKISLSFANVGRAFRWRCLTNRKRYFTNRNKNIGFRSLEKHARLDGWGNRFSIEKNKLKIKGLFYAKEYLFFWKRDTMIPIYD